MNNSTTAVMDASIAFAARRVLGGAHSDPNWEYQDTYDQHDDQLLFSEFLHYIVGYDKILIDGNSQHVLGHDLTDFLKIINSKIGRKWLEIVDLAHDSLGGRPIRFVKNSICGLLHDVRRNRIVNDADLQKIKIPWSYHQPAHHDFNDISQCAERFDLPNALVPYLLFLWRGLLYGAFAHYQSKIKGLPFVYIAAPGRLSAMRVVLSASDVKRAEYPRNALQELIGDLRGIPQQGYDFSFIRSLPTFAATPFTIELSRLPPDHALEFACDFRRRPEAYDLRRKWADHILDYSTTCAVGGTYSQHANNLHVEGDLTQIQIIRAQPLGG